MFRVTFCFVSYRAIVMKLFTSKHIDRIFGEYPGQLAPKPSSAVAYRELGRVEVGQNP